MDFKCKHILQISDYKVDPNYFNQLFDDEKGYYEYICCFNILHEICHSLCREYNSEFKNEDNNALNQVEEELLANDFAVAFWKLYGEKDFLERIFQLQNKRKLEGERIELLKAYDESTRKIYTCKDYKFFYRKYANLTFFNQLTFSSIPEEHSKFYNYFQNCSVVESFKKDLNLNNVLKAIGIVNHKPFDYGEKLIYDFNINTPKKLILDVSRIFKNHCIDTPVIQYCIVKDKICNCIKSVITA
jgi:hypothetical protein